MCTFHITNKTKVIILCKVSTFISIHYNDIYNKVHIVYKIDTHCRARLAL